ncbi:Vacuolar H+transporting two-sector ATPase F subunit [Ferroglobus placidus DSM 10642]|uniref:A-type ATP synthase subunit F n=1 Tax=Ferroglobus placidus (strain DSM 10642 / AEDII12DO) TaxID=589924 RepID=D3S1G5_FERPA|nr:V-type ATP synthase subunit F [Ferroglobus placidus]ADC66429.1 Vacuolar H+transporting two-sector ATPase F subunit [Ferroglobus placidus DSM 10642]
MKKIAVIGDPDFNVGFRLVGIRDVYDVQSDEEVVKAVEEVMKREDVGIVVIKNEFLDKIPISLRREMDESVEPTFVIVGGEGSVEALKEKIRRAIGVDLWK